MKYYAYIQKDKTGLVVYELEAHTEEEARIRAEKEGKLECIVEELPTIKPNEAIEETVNNIGNSLREWLYANVDKVGDMLDYAEGSEILEAYLHGFNE